MDDRNLQKLLDSLDEGPLGKPQAYWNKVEAIEMTRFPDVRKRAVQNTDWESRNKNLGISRKGKINEGLQQSNLEKRTPILAYRITHNGKKKENFKFLTKEFYKEYESLNQASKDIKINSAIIHNVLNPEHPSLQIKGWFFEYKLPPKE